MLDRIKTFFLREMAPPADDAEGEPGPEELRVAACALLLEVANADDFFSRGERRHVRGLVRRHFGLKRDAADELIVLAEEERRGSVDLWGFTNLIRTHYSAGQKLVLAEAMWGVVLADGELAAREGPHHAEDLSPDRARDGLSGRGPQAPRVGWGPTVTIAVKILVGIAALVLGVLLGLPGKAGRSGVKAERWKLHGRRRNRTGVHHEDDLRELERMLGRKTALRHRTKRYFTPHRPPQEGGARFTQTPLAALLPHRRPHDEAAAGRGPDRRPYPKRESTATMMPPMVAPRA